MSSRVAGAWRAIARPDQLPPAGEWDTWLIEAGRGSGKTRSGIEFAMDHLEQYPRARVAAGARTFAEARDVLAEGESGIMTLYRDDFAVYNRSLYEARHWKGGYLKFMGADQPARWRGPQWTLLLADELAQWPKDSWDMAQFGVRLSPAPGIDPRVVVMTTPNPRKFYVQLRKDEGVTRSAPATMYDNPGVAASFVRRIERRYGGTRLGQQEIYAMLLEDTPGAMWERHWIEENRWPTFGSGEPLPFKRIVVAVDPGGSHDDSDPTGIAVAGETQDGHYVILHVAAYYLPPIQWAKKALDLLGEWEGDKIIAERNHGGEMVESTIRTVRPRVALETIVASRGKEVRAQPISALYAQGLVHHAGVFSEAEDEMCHFPVDSDHDDMVDAIVYALTELAIKDEISWRPL